MSSTRRRSSGHHKAAHGTFVIDDDDDDDDDDQPQHHPVDGDDDETTHEPPMHVTLGGEITWGPTSTSTSTTTARYTKLTTPPSSTVELTTQDRASSLTRPKAPSSDVNPCSSRILVVDDDEEDTADFWNTANNNDDDTPQTPPPEWITTTLTTCCPCFRPFFFDDSSPPEATGLALDLWARGYILMSSLFVGPALLDLAQGAATWSGGTCDHNDADHANDNDANDNDCRVYGFKPTSLLANIAIGAGLLGSLTMPLVGAVIDHTPHRRGVAAVSAVVLGIVKAVEACIGPQTWFLVANLQVLSSLLYNTHATAAYAYTSELTTTMTTTTTTTTTMDSSNNSASAATNHATTTTNNNPQQSTRQAQYNAYFNIILYVSMLLFLMLVLLLAAWLVPLLVVEDDGEATMDDEDNNHDTHDDSFTSLGQLSSEAQANVYTARISQTVTGMVTIPCFILAWKYFFGPRPAAPLSIPSSLLLVEDNHDESTTTILVSNHQEQEQHHAQDEQPNHHSYSLWTIGFVKVAHTARSILRHNRPLAGALFSILLAEAAMSALATIATTYATHVLGMTGSEIGLLFFIVLVAGIPGSHYGGNIWTVRWSPPLSVVAAHVSFGVITTFSVFLLNGPGDKKECYLFGALWGFVIGWLSPADTSLFMSFLSSKNESSRAEWMGMFLLATSALSWLPPLVFTLLNEAGWHMKWGLASLNLYFVGAAMCLLLTK